MWVGGIIRNNSQNPSSVLYSNSLKDLISIFMSGLFLYPTSGLRSSEIFADCTLLSSVALCFIGIEDFYSYFFFSMKVTKMVLEMFLSSLIWIFFKQTFVCFYLDF